MPSFLFFVRDHVFSSWKRTRSKQKWTQLSCHEQQALTVTRSYSTAKKMPWVDCWTQEPISNWLNTHGRKHAVLIAQKYTSTHTTHAQTHTHTAGVTKAKIYTKVRAGMPFSWKPLNTLFSFSFPLVLPFTQLGKEKTELHTHTHMRTHTHTHTHTPDFMLEAA